MIDPLCINSMKRKEGCPVCSGNLGKVKVHTMQELIEAGYEEPKKKDSKK